jgi:predicted O-methyltransferase YrrM
MEQSFDDVLKKFGQYGIISHNPTNGIGLWPEEQIVLLNLAKDSHHYFEIGSHNLGSAILVETEARVNNKERKVSALDIKFSPWAALNYKRAKSSINMIERSSDDIAANATKDGLSNVDFLFIDGFHSFKQVLRDFEECADILAHNAIVAFHDTSPHLSKQSYIDECRERVDNNFDHLSNDESENFYIDEAIVWLADTYNYELIDCSVDCYHPRETRLNSWIRGKTSPSSAIWAIRTRG